MKMCKMFKSGWLWLLQSDICVFISFSCVLIAYKNNNKFRLDSFQYCQLAQNQPRYQIMFHIRDHPFKTSANFSQFWILPPYCWQIFTTIFDLSPSKKCQCLKRMVPKCLTARFWLDHWQVNFFIPSHQQHRALLWLHMSSPRNLYCWIHSLCCWRWFLWWWDK